MMTLSTKYVLPTVVLSVLLSVTTRPAFSETNAPTTPPQPVSYENLFPETTVAVFWIADAKSVLAGNAWEKFKSDPRVKPEYEKIIDAVKKLKIYVAPNWDERIKRLKDTLTGQMAIGIIGGEAGGTKNVDESFPVMLMAIRDRNRVKAMLSDYLEAVGKKNLLENTVIENLPVTTIHIDKDVAVHIVYRNDNQIMISITNKNDMPPIERQIQIFLAGKRLKDVPQYINAIQTIGRPNVAFGFLNVKTLLDSIQVAVREGQNMDEWKTFKSVYSALGLDPIAAFSFNIHSEKAVTHTTAFLDFPEKRTGLINVFEPTASDGITAMAHVPGNIGFDNVCSVSLHLNAVWPVVESVAKALQGDAGVNAVNKSKRDAPARTGGIDPYAFLDGLDGPVVGAFDSMKFISTYTNLIMDAQSQTPPEKPVALPFMLSCSIRDRQRVMPSLQMIMAMAMMVSQQGNLPFNVETKQYGASTGWTFILKNNQDEITKIILLATQKHLVLCGDDNIANQVAALDAGTGGSTITSDPIFLATVKRLIPDAKLQTMPASVDVAIRPPIDAEQAATQTFDLQIGLTRKGFRALRKEMNDDDFAAFASVFDAVLGINVNRIDDDQTQTLLAGVLDASQNFYKNPGVNVAMKDIFVNNTAIFRSAPAGLIMEGIGAGPMIHRGELVMGLYPTIIGVAVLGIRSSMAPNTAPMAVTVTGNTKKVMMMERSNVSGLAKALVLYADENDNGTMPCQPTPETSLKKLVDQGFIPDSKIFDSPGLPALTQEQLQTNAEKENGILYNQYYYNNMPGIRANTDGAITVSSNPYAFENVDTPFIIVGMCDGTTRVLYLKDDPGHATRLIDMVNPNNLNDRLFFKDDNLGDGVIDTWLQPASRITDWFGDDDDIGGATDATQTVHTPADF